MNLSAIDIDILRISSKKGKAGIDKEELLFELAKVVKGIAYSDLAKRIHRLGENGAIRVEENGPDDFTVFITDTGSKLISDVP
jgi:predicted transcriptional regulator